MNPMTAATKNLTPLFLERIKNKQPQIQQWLKRQETAHELPLYYSVDTRNAGFKTTVVDTNLFPAGFNNLCEHGLAASVKLIRNAILKRVPHGRRILIIAEEHTRNLWYLENVRILQQIIRDAGFEVKIGTFLTEQPHACETGPYIEMQTATQQTVRIHCFKSVLERLKSGKEQIDLAIMNNDLTGGIPDVLRDLRIPIYPSIQAGWHARLKSHHFGHTADLIREFGKILELDPWFFSCLYSVEDQVDINRDEDRLRLKDAASALFSHIEKKYKEHQIAEKPYVVLKPDAGTYGLGVTTIENPEDLIQLNRKERNKIYKGKGSQVIHRYLLQEGVPTIYSIESKASEVVIYQIENNFVGGFYRSHAGKGHRENLNTKGMDFHQMCPQKYGDDAAGEDFDIFDLYRVLARIAGIAAHREIVQLEAKSS